MTNETNPTLAEADVQADNVVSLTTNRYKVPPCFDTEFNKALLARTAEGTTQLVVRQTPRSDDKGFTWPASRFSKTRLQEGTALYFNTALFEDELLALHGIHAKEYSARRVSELVLDDLGSKITKRLTTPPTWIMETSEGNFQHGYFLKLDSLPSTIEFAEAISGVANAGYTDKGMVNAVRNYRAEGSTNLKAGKNSFKARIIEFHPDREYTLAEILEADGIVPDITVHHDNGVVVLLEDISNDDILEWLNTEGKVISAPERSGWAKITCPWGDEHTDGPGEAYWHGGRRAFKCHHSHGATKKTHAFHQWVKAEGGPDVINPEHGIQSLRKALARLEGGVVDDTPTPFQKSQLEKLAVEIKTAERAIAQKLGLNSMFEQFAYCDQNGDLFDLKARKLVSQKVVSDIYSKFDTRSTVKLNDNGVGLRVSGAQYFTERMEEMNCVQINGMTYAAGEDIIYEEYGAKYGNRWVDHRLAGVEGDVAIWLAHVERMIPNRKERGHVLDTMAFKVQFPKRKINHAILHYGVEGSGKDAMWSPFFRAVGMPNIAVNDVDQIKGEWGYNLEKEVIVFNELKEAQASERRALANKLKDLIAAPPDKLEVRRKGEHPYSIPNRAFVMAFTNHATAISLAATDRRWFCVHSEAPRMEDTDANALWGWYEAGGYEKVAYYLQHRDVSAYNPFVKPENTEFKLAMVEEARSDAESIIINAIREGQSVFKDGVVCGPWVSIVDILHGQLFTAHGTGVKLYTTALLQALREAGWIDRGMCGANQTQTKKHLFCRPDLKDNPKAQLKALWDELPPNKNT